LPAYAGLRELFKTIDVDGSGTITVEEMRTSLRKWDHKINEEELKKLMDIADVDGDGTINYEEFVGATMHLSKLEKEELLQKAFRCGLGVPLGCVCSRMRHACAWGHACR
jgi:calcium-dependent protein kinase